MKKIIIILVCFVLCSLSAIGQTFDYNISLRSGQDADSVNVLLTDRAGQYEGRGHFRTISYLANLLQPYISSGPSDHGALTGLLDDDHTQYALLSGRSTGQTFIGGTTTTSNLLLQSTSANGTLGSGIRFKIGNNGATEAMTIMWDGKIGIGNTVPQARLQITSTTEQQRTSYNSSNYYSTTVGSTGLATFNSVGTTPKFVFSDSVQINGTLGYLTNGATPNKIAGRNGNEFSDITTGYGLLLSSGTLLVDTSIIHSSNWYDAGNYLFPAENESIHIPSHVIDGTGKLNVIGRIDQRFPTSAGTSIAIGQDALSHNLSGLHNVAIGMNAMHNSESGTYNTAIGKNALYSNVTGTLNTAVGAHALYYAEGLGNIGLGSQAGENWTGSGRLFIDITNTNEPLIGGDFFTDSVHIHGQLGYFNNGGIPTRISGRSGTLFSDITTGYGLSLSSGSLLVDSTKLATQFDISTFGSPIWGTISGTLSNQTDLQNSLNLKLNLSDTAAMNVHFLERGDNSGGDVSGKFGDIQLGSGVVGAAELASTTVVAGSYPNANITVDADGRLTSASTPILAIGHPASSLTNSTIADQDYSSIYTIPSNYLTENKLIKVTLGIQWTTGVSTATIIMYIKLGSTKVLAFNAGVNNTNSITQSSSLSFFVSGTASPGASVAVESNLNGPSMLLGAVNGIVQPVNIATNGNLNIVPGLTFSATGSTETYVIRTFLVEAIN